MTTFIMMIGLVASGKSYETEILSKEYNANIHSSDAIREELSGDINNQDINDLVFKTLHNRVKEDLKNGKNCIYDATNINYKRRMAFLRELNSIPCEKICVLMATPYEVCLERNAKRDRKVPENVIKRMYMNFDIPYWYEGWDDIRIKYSSNSESLLGIPVKWIENVKNYNQENSHHTLTLGEHCWQAAEYLDRYSSTALQYATILHDCGKPFCKTFTNTKGEVTDQAHYYFHEHIGSYNSLFYDINNYNLNIAILIRWHMQPYFWEKDNNEKQRNKYYKLWGEELYSDVMKLHEADKNAH